MSETAAAARLSADEPWPGLLAFEEADRAYFSARGAKTEELIERVLSARLTTLYGQSGLGKTSLLQAGLFPKLREAQCLPVSVRLRFDAAAPPLPTQVLDELEAAARGAQVSAPTRGSGETLWQHLYRR